MPPQNTIITSSNVLKDIEEDVAFPSSCGFKYPPHRDDPRMWADLWLDDKRITDGAEGLWRIHDKLYDLNDWAGKHPGGKDWIEVTKGTDITEQFETYHISLDAKKILPKFFIRNAVTPRNSPFLFEEKGFYKTLKSRVRDTVKNIPDPLWNTSKIITDILLISFIVTAVLTAYYHSYFFGFLSGTFLNMLAIAAHNFFHQKDNFRMYYFDLFLMSHKDWRISHAMSHHLYTNTVNDLEVSLLQPFLLYLPKDNTFWQRVISCVISPFVWTFLVLAHVVKKYTYIISFGSFKSFDWKVELLPLCIPTMMYYVGEQGILWTFVLWMYIIHVASFYFGLVGFNAAHHHPELFHDGDTPRKNRDWGLFQLDSVIDRHEINGSSFLVLVSFGDHVLHHLFPTLDHSKLPYLYPDLYKTCDEFNVKYRMISQWNLVKGQYAQLLRSEKNPNEPGIKWKWYITFWKNQKRNFWESLNWIIPKKNV